MSYGIKNEQIKCTKEEKLKCFQTIELIMDLVADSKSYGLIWLEHQAKNVTDFLLKKGIELVANGISPEMIDKILMNYIEASDATKIERMNQLLIREGVLLIQQGDSIELIYEILLSYLGEEVVEEACIFFKNIKNQKEQSRDYLYTYFQQVKDKPAIIPEELEFKSLLLNINELYKMTAAADTTTLALALGSMSGVMQRRLIQYMPSGKAVLIIAEMIKYDFAATELIDRSTRSRKKILSLLDDLEKKGELIRMDCDIIENLLENYLCEIKKLKERNLFNNSGNNDSGESNKAV